MSPIFTLDFEASCLPQHGRSFPIEVGLAGPDGSVCAWLIRPEPAWRDWTWTQEAEQLHGLSRDQLDRDGLPAGQVLDEVAEVLRGRPAYADSYLDAGWMRTLEAAGQAPPLVSVRHIDALIHQLDLPDPVVTRAVAEVAALPFRRHRAGEDARWLQALAGRLTAEAQARAPAPERALQAA